MSAVKSAHFSVDSEECAEIKLSLDFGDGMNSADVTGAGYREDHSKMITTPSGCWCEIKQM